MPGFLTTACGRVPMRTNVVETVGDEEEARRFFGGRGATLLWEALRQLARPGTFWTRVRTACMVGSPNSNGGAGVRRVKGMTRGVPGIPR